jgi:hypothetical protein
MSYVIADNYEIVSVESTIPPAHMGGTGWHCYVIGQGSNTIRGYQQGSLEAVRQSAEEIVRRLNERRLGKPSHIAKPGRMTPKTGDR